MHQAPAVVVGVDGSCSATAAALWAIDEAMSRDIPLRLLHAVPHRDRPTTTDDIDRASDIVDTAAGDLVLRRGIDEALLRAIPLRVVTAWPASYPDVQGGSSATMTRMVRTRLQRRLSAWREQHPGLDARAVAVPGNILNYLARHRDEIALAIVPHGRGAGIAELVSTTPPSSAPDLSFNVLICEPAGDD